MAHQHLGEVPKIEIGLALQEQGATLFDRLISAGVPARQISLPRAASCSFKPR